MLTARLEDGLAAEGALLPSRALRAPHILCVGFRAGMPAGLIEALAEQRAFAAPRLGRVRISPHVYNDEEDVDRFLDAWRRVMSRAAAA
jgi:selenocysteine lyase/cysteine desulfurase